MKVGLCAVCDRSLRTEEVMGLGVGGWFVQCWYWQDSRFKIFLGERSRGRIPTRIPASCTRLNCVVIAHVESVLYGNNFLIVANSTLTFYHDANVNLLQKRVRVPRSQCLHHANVSGGPNIHISHAGPALVLEVLPRVLDHQLPV